MRNIAILSVLVLLSLNSFAQRAGKVQPEAIRMYDPLSGVLHSAKTTVLGDTLTLSHIATTDSLTIYKLASGGYVTGTNFWGDKAFAERYDHTDDTGKNMKVIGLFALFSGNVTAASNKTVTFTVWDEGPKQMISATRHFRGFPNNILDTLTVPGTQLGIGATIDTLKQFLFATPTVNFHSSFFIGYSINYDYASLAGDTLGLASTLHGDRFPAIDYTFSYNVSTFDTTLDTVFNVQNAVKQSDNRWYDNYSQNDSIRNNLAIYPIIIMGYPASVKGITRNYLTFYGNYPNPTTGNTNVKFSLAKNTDITIQLMDMSGRVLNTSQENNVDIGEHILQLNTAALPAGEYLYLLRTTDGDGIAGKIIKQ
ncbi:MAG: Secretion system C-terminal sorting domain [Flavipsychrobacter sp.]|jgi:hypothetical protein|nr:Secretion system C-terminal sorting domain [Flavipsychrobacter sp.]